MAISPDTFDALKRFVSVRLQQGVPLVDADWNEMEDIHKFELRSFLKWFVGDGIPANPDGSLSDAFRVISLNTQDNIKILSGGKEDAFQAGRCLVNGLEVFITKDIHFEDQPLYESYTGVTPSEHPDFKIVDPNAKKIKPIPNIDGSILVYLDVWEWEVNETVDPDLINPIIRIPTCVRYRRDWAVRTRLGKDIPHLGEKDYLANHSYYALAQINCSKDKAIISKDIIDLRRTGLTVSECLKYLKIPVYENLPEVLIDSQILAELFEKLSIIYRDRLKVIILFLIGVQGMTEDITRALVFFNLQQITQICSAGALQAKTHNLNKSDAVQILETLRDAQNSFLDMLLKQPVRDPHRRLNPFFENFIDDYKSLLNKIKGDLVVAFKTQKEINDWLEVFFLLEEIWQTITDEEQIKNSSATLIAHFDDLNEQNKDKFLKELYRQIDILATYIRELDDREFSRVEPHYGRKEWYTAYYNRIKHYHDLTGETADVINSLLDETISVIQGNQPDIRNWYPEW